MIGRTLALGGALLFAAGVAASCSSSPPTVAHPTAATASAGARSAAPKGSGMELAAQKYPDLEAIYAGDQGMYRGCGPNNGVCHNAKEFPNFMTVGAIADQINADCNQKRDRADEIHDLCEKPGDLFRHGDETIEIGYFAAADADNLADAGKLKIRLRHAVGKMKPDERQDIVRKGEKGTIVLASFSDEGLEAKLDPKDESHRTLLVDLGHPPKTPDADTSDDYDAHSDFMEKVTKAGAITDPAAIQLGDPNHDEMYGAKLGGKLIVPGDPSRSYLMVRLTDPSAGPPMPRANCCFWSKAALRALYCWIAGLKADGGNALEPIDYAKCPAGPSEDIDYPEPGPDCDPASKCPVMPRLIVQGEPTWPRIYANVLRAGCSGGQCHFEEAVGGLDLRTEETAYKTVRARVVPGKPDESPLYQRIDPSTCKPPHCSLMPRGRPPLDEPVRAAIKRWIERGAPRE